MEFDYQKQASGLQVFTVPKADTQAVTIMVLVGVGSNHESKGQYGLAHFLEHMCFKGTKRRPNPFAIVSELDGLGAQYNAFTSHEYTGYYIKLHKEKAEQAMDIISDIYHNSVFAVEEMESEKGVVIEEIKMRADDPGTVAYDRYLQNILRDQPGGRPIVGTEQDVAQFTPAMLREFHSNTYVGANTILCVAGGVDTKTSHDLVERYFSTIPAGSLSQSPRNSVQTTEFSVDLLHKPTEQTHVVMGFGAFGRADERKVALTVLSTILGGSMSSRLFHRLREEMGIAYYVGSERQIFSTYGMLTLFAGVGTKRAKEGVEALWQECQKLTQDMVWVGELDRAKQYLQGHLALDLEASDALAMFLGKQALMGGEVLTPNAYRQHLEDVSAEEVLSLAREVMRIDAMTLSVVGPHTSQAQFEKVIN